MGKSTLCNFYGELRSGTKGYTVGLRSIKEAKNWIKSTNDVNVGMGKIDSVFMIPQTSYAKKISRGFYCLKITGNGIEYLNITDK